MMKKMRKPSRMMASNSDELQDKALIAKLVKKKALKPMAKAKSKRM